MWESQVRMFLLSFSLASALHYTRRIGAEAYDCHNELAKVQWTIEFLNKLEYCSEVGVLVRPASGSSISTECLVKGDEVLQLSLRPSQPSKQLLDWSLTQKEHWWQEPLTWAAFQQGGAARPLTLWPITQAQTLSDFLGFKHLSGMNNSIRAGSLVATFFPDLSATKYDLNLTMEGSAHPPAHQTFELKVPDEVDKGDSNKFNVFRCGPNLAYTAPSAFDFLLMPLPFLRPALPLKSEKKLSLESSSLPYSVQEVLMLLSQTGKDKMASEKGYVDHQALPRSDVAYVLPQQQVSSNDAAYTGKNPWPILFVIKPSFSASRFTAWTSTPWGKKFSMLRNLQFLARTISTRAIVAGQVGAFSPELGGYPVHVDLAEPGPFRLQVGLSWLYGGAEDAWFAENSKEVPAALTNRRLGHYSNHMMRPDEARRMVVIGSGVLFYVHAHQPELPSLPRCHEQALFGRGRWLNLDVKDHKIAAVARAPNVAEMDEFFSALAGGVQSHERRNHLMPLSPWQPNTECESSVCTGSAQMAFVTDGVRSPNNRWVYAPYTCVPHLYSKGEMFRCVTSLAVKHTRKVRQYNGLHPYDRWERPKHEPLYWIHVTGDSTVREVGSFFFERFKTKSFSEASTKFEEKEGTWGKFGRLKVTYRSPGLDRIDADKMFKEDTAWWGRYNLDLSNITARRPDVWVVDPLWAYTAWKTSLPEFIKWLDLFCNYARAIAADDSNLNPIRIIWHEPKWMFSPAHARTHEMTSERAQARALLARKKIRNEPAITFLNATAVTMARWEHEAYDGLHYMERQGQGAVSQWVGFLLVNGLWGECDQLELTNQEKLLKQNMSKEATEQLLARQREYEQYEELKKRGPHSLDVGVCVRDRSGKDWIRAFTYDECLISLHGWKGRPRAKMNGTTFIECIMAEGGSHSWDFSRFCPSLCASCTQTQSLVCAKPRDNATRAIICLDGANHEVI
eukprot:gb/GEZN01001372.1/.p1 GENE.gb/GEZN01001372.1/~~gb/GEZN01001372.1/.p1  ORF type:complete len:961 (-),score=81.77 gb/GEZN01001372.1/:191-3073(-)